MLTMMSLTNCLLGQRGNKPVDDEGVIRDGLLATSDLVLFRYCVVSLTMGLTVADGEGEKALLLLGCSDGKRDDGHQDNHRH